ncbi:hypothetical protein CEXT_264091 [Caerostris extrusa]|uniref:Uncharacterized protein n=1 Tax=Caerostris extrusa TaxID=172846 RepID=A0AAV4P705_CAEEX|nr:hypothetical protein CEXT_264091 [Caerostris extrusa]
MAFSLRPVTFRHPLALLLNGQPPPITKTLLICHASLTPLSQGGRDLRWGENDILKSLGTSVRDVIPDGSQKNENSSEEKDLGVEGGGGSIRLSSKMKR